MLHTKDYLYIGSLAAHEKSSQDVTNITDRKEIKIGLHSFIYNSYMEQDFWDEGGRGYRSRSPEPRTIDMV